MLSMVRTVLVMLLMPAAACADHPDIAGKASVLLDDETLVLDTGDDGQRFVKTGERWSTACNVKYGGLSMTLERAPDGDPPLKMIALLVSKERENGELAPNVIAELKKQRYGGFCDVVATVGGDPHDVEFSAADCELQRAFDGHHAWLVSASFRVMECENE
ncbi:hypothetical protein WME77_36840 [Sorangium sp. So ce764]|uniref:hypothetical protein n=1 Tax=Sorangium sp. So ce764 TaxID=3133320 RepID=UPI003F6063A8